LYRNFLVIFGGGNGQTALNDIWALDISDPTRLTWEEWPTQGEAPARKGYHTANLVGDKMIVFGGSDGHASFADVHVLNLSECYLSMSKCGRRGEKRMTDEFEELGGVGKEKARSQQSKKRRLINRKLDVDNSNNGRQA